jgi:hypothetical protein
MLYAGFGNNGCMLDCTSALFSLIWSQDALVAMKRKPSQEECELHRCCQCNLENLLCCALSRNLSTLPPFVVQTSGTVPLPQTSQIDGGTFYGHLDWCTYVMHVVKGPSSSQIAQWTRESISIGETFLCSCCLLFRHASCHCVSSICQ